MLPPWTNFGAALVAAFWRFPLPIACGVIFALWQVQDRSPQTLGTVPLACLIGFFTFIAIRLVVEARGWQPPVEWLLYGVASVLVGAHAAGLTYRLDGGGVSVASAFALVTAWLLAACTAPFLTKTDDDAFWAFNRTAWTGAAFGLLFALTLAVGVAAAFVLLDVLFDTGVPGDLVRDIFIIALAVVWPWVALTGVPRDFGATLGSVPRALDIVVTYGLAPLTIAYMAILGVYLVVIAVRWTLPDGGLAWTICGYAVFGVAVHLLSYPLRESARPWVRLYHRYFHLSLLPLSLVLVLAAGVRIAAYGLTEPRYFLLLVALWLGVLAALVTVRPSTRLSTAPVTLAVLLALASVGPWGAHAASVASQQRHLTDLLISHGLLQDGRLLPAGETVPPDDAERIADIARYLGSKDSLVALPGVQPSQFDGRSALLAATRVPEDPHGTLITHYSYTPDIRSAVSVRDFDVYERIEFWDEDLWTHRIADPGADVVYNVTFSRADNTLSVSAPDRGPVVFDLRRFTQDPPTLEDDAGPTLIWQRAENGLHVAMEVENVRVRTRGRTATFWALEAIVLIGRDSPTVPNEGGRSP